MITRRSFIVVWFLLTALGCICPLQAAPQREWWKLPHISAMDVPRYPALAGMVGIRGRVRVLVQTDGSKIEKILSSSGPPKLVKETEEYLSSWRFEKHEPTRFEITFNYRISKVVPCPPGKPDVIKMVLPTYIEIFRTRTKECDPVAN